MFTQHASRKSLKIQRNQHENRNDTFYKFFFVGAIAFWINRGEWLYPVQAKADAILSENLAEVTVGQSFVARQAGLQTLPLDDWLWAVP